LHIPYVLPKVASNPIVPYFLLYFLSILFVFLLPIHLMGHIFHRHLFLIFLTFLLHLRISFVSSLLILLKFLLIPIVSHLSFIIFLIFACDPFLSFLSFGFFFISCPLSLSYSAPLPIYTIHVLLSTPCHKISSSQLCWRVL
jgi:hypothetical protein